MRHDLFPQEGLTFFFLPTTYGVRKQTFAKDCFSTLMLEEAIEGCVHIVQN